MTSYQSTMTTEQRIKWMMANNVAIVGIYADSFEPLVNHFKEQRDAQNAHEDLIVGQALLRAYDLVPYVISKSTVQARTFRDEWQRRYENAWSVFRLIMRSTTAKNLIPEEYINDEDLRDKIIKSYIYYTPELHQFIAAEIKSLTNQSDEQLAQKAIWFTDAALKRSYINL